MSAPTPDSVYLWARLQATRLRALFASTTRAERTMCVAFFGALVGAILRAFALGGAESWLIVGVVVLLMWIFAAVLAEGVIQRENTKRMGAAMIALNREKPTGAPRVAEVVCIHGEHHRYVYGMGGWEAAGPSVDHRPAVKEAPAP